MSLNGLDTPEIQDAYQQAVAEAAGWLLLKYTTRDEVDLLGKGKLGVSEARNAITDYLEPSPLYGLIIYRRRKVLIKYIPTGTSRLLQARTAVHFQDVIERFSPHDTLLEIATSEALNDTSLAASFPLHTASPMPTTSNRLQEISEDAEDPGGLVAPSPASGRSSSKHSSSRVRMDRRSDIPRIERLERASRVSDGSGDGLSLSPTAPSKTSLAQFLLAEASRKASITSLEQPSSSISMSQAEETPRSASLDPSFLGISNQSIAAARRISSLAARSKDDPLPELPDKDPVAVQEKQTTNGEPPVRGSVDSRRPSAPTAPETSSAKQSYEDDYDFSRFDHLWKPKVKLGPRPVADAEKVKRPTAATVSGLPANIRQNIARKPEPTRAEPTRAEPAEQKKPAPAITNAPLPLPPIPDTPDYQARPVSRGSVRSVSTHKSASTADKARLIKAMELRKKQKRNMAQTATPPVERNSIAEHKSSEAPIQAPAKELGKSLLDNVLEEEGSRTHTSKADSGIGYEKPASGDPAAATSGGESHETQIAAAEAAKGGAVVDSPEESPAQATVQPAVADVSSLPVSTKPSPDAAIDTEKQDDTADEIPILDDTIPVIVVADGQQLDTADSPREGMDANTLGATKEPSREPSFVTSELIDSEDEFEDAVDVSRHTMVNRRKGFVEPLQTDLATSGNPDDFASEDEDFLEELQSATVHEAKPMLVSPTSRSSGAVAYMGLPRQPSVASISGHSEGALSVRSISISKPSGVPAEKTPETTDILMPDMMPDLLMPDMLAFENNKVPLTYTPTGAAPSAPTDKSDALAGYSRNVSSGISRRIQALAELSNRETPSPSGYTPASTRSLTPETSFLGHDQRKLVQRSVQPTRSSHYKRSSNRSSFSHGSTPSNVSDNAPVLSFQHDPITNRNSVSVTTRIIRPALSMANVAEPTMAEPQLDPDVQLASESLSSPSHTDLPPLNTSQLSMRSRGASSSSMQSLSPTNTSRPSPNEGRVMHSAVTTRFGRHHFPHHYKNPGTFSSALLDDYTNPSGSPHPASRAHSVASTTGTDDNGSVVRDSGSASNSSRASRFLRRMSNIGTVATGGLRKGSKPSLRASRESLSSPSTPVASGSRSFGGSKVDVSSGKSLPADHPDMPPAVVVGDLNVQFPEALLWKRRIVTIDAAGYLQFSIAQALDIHKAVAIRRHHLSAFLPPAVPDAEHQELPYSVVLEFVDGSHHDGDDGGEQNGDGDENHLQHNVSGTTIQAACEDALTHRAVVHLLKSYHRQWAKNPPVAMNA